MFPFEVVIAYTLAAMLVVLSPGPDNILVIGRGLSQGKWAACVSAAGAGVGILCHSLAAAYGLAVVIQSSATAFWVLKVIGAAYLLYLGWKVLRSRSLFSFEAAALQPLRSIFTTAVLSNVLNPKPGLFVLAFVPQFVSPDRGSVSLQIVAYGAWFALLTTGVFSLMGSFASQLTSWLKNRPKVILGLNLGAGLSFIAAGLSILAIKQRG